MRAREFIVEYREDITRRQYGEAIIKQMLNGPDGRSYTQNLLFRQGPIDTRNYESPYDKDALLKEAFAYIGDGDPTYNWTQKTGGIYIPWIAREYSKGNIKRLEDCPSRVNAALTSYHKYKTKRDFKERFPDMLDIMRTNWEDLEYVMNTYEPPVEFKDRGNSETIYDGEDARVIVPQDQQAACYYGQGTRWCTASTRGENYFENYNRQGPLYIILPKNPQHENEKYQVHPQSGQYMDINDSPIGLYELYTLYPKALRAIAEVDPKMGDMVLFSKPDVVVGIWNAVSDLVVEAAERLSKKPQFSTDLTDSARERIESDVQTISMLLYDKTYREIMEEYGYRPTTTIPYLARDIHHQIAMADIDDEFKLHIVSYLDYTVGIIKKESMNELTSGVEPTNYEVYKTVGNWAVIVKSPRQQSAKKQTKYQYEST